MQTPDEAAAAAAGVAFARSEAKWDRLLGVPPLPPRSVGAPALRAGPVTESVDGDGESKALSPKVVRWNSSALKVASHGAGRGGGRWVSGFRAEGWGASRAPCRLLSDGLPLVRQQLQAELQEYMGEEEDAAPGGEAAVDNPWDSEPPPVAPPRQPGSSWVPGLSASGGVGPKRISSGMKRVSRLSQSGASDGAGEGGLDGQRMTDGDDYDLKDAEALKAKRDAEFKKARRFRSVLKLLNSLKMRRSVELLRARAKLARPRPALPPLHSHALRPPASHTAGGAPNR